MCSLLSLPRDVARGGIDCIGYSSLFEVTVKWLIGSAGSSHGVTAEIGVVGVLGRATAISRAAAPNIMCNLA